MLSVPLIRIPGSTESRRMVANRLVHDNVLIGGSERRRQAALNWPEPYTCYTLGRFCCSSPCAPQIATNYALRRAPFFECASAHVSKRIGEG